MSSFGGSRSIADQRVYVQETPPNDRRAGVRWFDTSTDAAVAHVYSVDHGEFMRESRVWVQDVEPEPRVGPLDGDRWVDVSQEKRPTLVYSASLSDWVNPVNVSWGEVASKPDTVGQNPQQTGGWQTASDGFNIGTESTETHTVEQNLEIQTFDQYEWTISGNGDNVTLNEVNVYVDGELVASDSTDRALDVSGGSMIDGRGQICQLEFTVTNSYYSSAEYINIDLDAFVPTVAGHNHPL